jgi:membrane fusion protein (multidrug efflux system)
VISASKQEISSILELTGSVEPYRLAQLASPAEGPVLDLSVREGDRVKAGDRLLSIGRKEGIAALVVSLREELKKEEDNLRRTRQLVEGDALPGEQLDQARASYEGVRAQLVKAEESALDYDIVAPWDGVISRLLVKEGDFVPPRGALLEMYDPYSLVIRAAVPERYAAEVRADMRVGVSLDAYPESALEGRIVRVYPYLDPHTRTRNMEIVLAGPIDLLPGMFARLKLRMKTAKDAVVVPTEAVATTTAGQHVVFVVEGGKASIRQVETGIEEGNRVQIVSGLNPGDKVVVAGNEALKDGDPVRLAGEEGVGKGKSTNAAGVPTEQDKKSEGGRP